MAFIPKAQEIYKHFKGNLYQIVTVAEHTETGEVLVIYQAMYGSFKIYARPLAMFTEKVDKAKYPQATQEYRFELVRTVGEEQDVTEQSVLGQQSTEQSVFEQSTEQTATGCNDIEQIEPGQSVAEPKCEESNSEEELQLDPLLLQFLDADTYEERLNILAAVHHRITDEMITTMAIASDVEVPEGDIETRYAELRNCLLTLDKYEINRLG